MGFVINMVLNINQKFSENIQGYKKGVIKLSIYLYFKSFQVYGE
jgi:hypothetical protein